MSNLPEVLAAWEAYQLRLDKAIGAAAVEVSLRLEGEGKRMIKGHRPEGQTATSGAPPMNRTGNLRRSIKGSSAREGFGIYSAIVGAGMIYARAVELGEPYNPPSWKNGQKFPFLKPAVEGFVQTGLLSRIIYKHLGAI